MKKFIGELRSIGNGDYEVGLIHYMPFDKEHGMGKTEEELLQIGVLVDEIPYPTPQEGKGHKLIYNENTGTVRIEYFDIQKPLDKQQLMENELQQLKERQALIQQALDDLLLGGM
jgi:hypothetical protein